MDVLGCMLAGLIFGVLTTFGLTAVRWKRIFVLLIVAYLIAAFADALVKRAKRSPDEKSTRTRLP
jgi:O-antigen ligase